MIPAGILGLLFDDVIEKYLFSVPTVMIGLFVGAIYMIVADMYSKKSKSENSRSNHLCSSIYYWFVPIAMCQDLVDLVPTISTGVLMKMNHKAASDFTFMMAVPVMLGASGLSLVKNIEFIHANQIPFYILGF